mmetsp:Transcript_4680/g.9645  ORF Transcript_4680/g.9645 Transcript_4680/m.9645 type:complete len:133 (+) Transcript_4680:430-828(+)
MEALSKGSGSKAMSGSTDISGPSTPVVPLSRKRRSSMLERQADLEELKTMGIDANLLLDGETPRPEVVPSYSSLVPTYNSWGSKIGVRKQSNNFWCHNDRFAEYAEASWHNDSDGGFRCLVVMHLGGLLYQP